MHYLVLATDFDGTIARDGHVDAVTVSALGRVRESGRRLVLVTGRELVDLLATFPRCDLFDWVAVENGAVLYHPATKESRVLAPPPPRALVEVLTRRGVPVSVGQSIVATVTPHEHTVLAAIRDLGLEWHVVFNKGSVMALPSGVTKVTGLMPALDELDVPAARTVGIGDAENDHAFLRICGLGVAVANALPALKADADVVTAGAYGDGVVEVIHSILLDDLATVTARPERHEPSWSGLPRP
jgi:hydroxymethylpyrimidine pyrophosphatase-like HAD family hydrolase